MGKRLNFHPTKLRFLQCYLPDYLATRDPRDRPRFLSLIMRCYVQAFEYQHLEEEWVGGGELDGDNDALAARRADVLKRVCFVSIFLSRTSVGLQQIKCSESAHGTGIRGRPESTGYPTSTSAHRHLILAVPPGKHNLLHRRFRVCTRSAFMASLIDESHRLERSLLPDLPDPFLRVRDWYGAQ
jgi:hypothetical protein